MKPEVYYMMHKQNLHTHTRYCDGSNLPEELILSAIAQGFTSIGFSGHSNMQFAPDRYMAYPNDTNAYKKEINSLKEKYSDQIQIFCGLEYEFQSECDLSGFDYLIGSAHYFCIDGEYVGFDRSAEEVRRVILNHFDGDGMKYAKAYYEMLARLPERGTFDIVAHFDLITKHCERVPFFNEDTKEYQNYAIEAAEALARKIPFFEVNTGAIARGYRTTPYPAPFIIKELKRLGFGAVVTSDCHDKNKLACCRTEAMELLAACGFKEQFVLTEKGFLPVPLEMR